MIFLLLSPLLDREPVVGGAGEVHAEKPGQDQEAYRLEMMCGATVLVDAEGQTLPPGFDWYLYEHGHKATCAACRKALGL